MILGNLIQDTWKFVNSSIDLYKDTYVKKTDSLMHTNGLEGM